MLKKENYKKLEMEILEFAENKIYMDGSDLNGKDTDKDVDKDIYD